MRFKLNKRRFVRWRVSNEIPTSKCTSYRSSLPYWQTTRRTNFHRTLLWPLFCSMFRLKRNNQSIKQVLAR